jgi:hypothetical protein
MRVEKHLLFESSAGSENRPVNWLLGQRLLGLGFGHVLVANRCDNVEFQHTTEHLGGNIRAARVVAEIFGKQFFAPVRSRKARLDRYLRNGESPNPIPLLYDA